MSFSNPTVEVQSPVAIYLDTNARDGEIRVFDNITKEKEVVKSGKIEVIVLDSKVGMYSGYKPDGDHTWSNHFRTGLKDKGWCVIQGKLSGTILEGNPNSKAFREEARKLKPATKYHQMLYCNYNGQIAVLKLRGTVLSSFLQARKALRDSIDNQPLMTVEVGKQVTVQGQKIYSFEFSFAPLASDKKLYEECVAMDELIQPWLDEENTRRTPEEVEPEAEEQHEGATSDIIEEGIEETEIELSEEEIDEDF